MNIDNFKALEIEIDYKDIIEQSCEELSQNIREKALNTFKGKGDYAKSWTYEIKKVKGDYEGVVLNKDYYRLTHLLENGHLIKNGVGTYGYTSPKPHTKPSFEGIKNKFIESMNNAKIKIK